MDLHAAVTAAAATAGVAAKPWVVVGAAVVAEVAAAVPVASWLGDPVQAVWLATQACCQKVQVPCTCNDGKTHCYLECLPEHQ